MTHDRFIGWLTVATLISMGVVALDAAGLPLAPLRIVAGAFLALVAPGAALLAALRAPFLAGIARAVLAIPMSLGLLALTGVVLDRTPIGVRPAAVVVASAVLTLGLLIIATWRVRRSRPAGSPAVSAATSDVDTPGGEGGWTPDRVDHDGPRVARRGPRRLVGEITAHVRDPLFLNAYALGLSGVVTSGLGVVYWAAAARLYPADVVGVNAALLSLVTLLANVAQLNLRSGFGRFLPVAGRRTWSMVAGGYVVTTALAMALALGVVGLLVAAPGLLPDVVLTPTLAAVFALTVVLWTAFTVQDHVLVGLRRTPIVPVENGVFALAKVILLVPLAGVLAGYGILVSWLLPTAVGVAVVTGWILFRLLPRRQREAATEVAPANAERVTPGDVVRYVGADYAGSLFAIGSTAILPVIVLATLGAESSAHFYMVSLIATATQLVPSVLTTSLLVEVSSSSATFEVDGRRILRQLSLLLGPIVLVLVVFAEPILAIFGPSYAAEGATALRLMALAGIPYALINLAFIRLRLERRVGLVVAAQAVLAVLLVVPALVVLPQFGITGLGVVILAAHTVVAVALSAAELRPLLAATVRELTDRGALRSIARPSGAEPPPSPR